MKICPNQFLRKESCFIQKLIKLYHYEIIIPKISLMPDYIYISYQLIIEILV